MNGGGGETDGRTEIVIFALSPSPPLLHQHSLLLFLPDRVWDVVSAESRDARMSNKYKNLYTLYVLGTM